MSTPETPAETHEHRWFRDYHTNDPNEDTWTCTVCLVTVADDPNDPPLKFYEDETP